jgi:4-amino-4-deoxy-L-arabinose transferase-like glycosyltransferase
MQNIGLWYYTFNIYKFYSMTIHNKPLGEFIKENSILVLLVVLAAFLRIYQLNTHGILFFDAGHDLLSAHQAVESGSIPLVGISSSRPWLHQGPVAIWIEMIVMVIFGTSTLAQHITFALIGMAAVIALYELITIHYNKKAAYYAVALLAVFPLAVASSRMPYHTTPIPLATVLYLWALTSLWKKYSIKKVFLVILAGIFLFQFELCNAPLFILIPYVFWRRKYKITKKLLLWGTGALILGLLPQVIFSFTGQSNQIVEFTKWFVTQILERLQDTGQTTSKLTDTLRAFAVFGGRIFGVDSIILSIVGGLTTIAALFFTALKWRRSGIPEIVELAVCGFFVLAGAYLVAGPPSEAYFPPFFILLAIILSYFFAEQKPRIQPAVIVGVIIFMIINTVAIFNANFFVHTQNAFRYDSVGEQRAILKTLNSRSRQQPYQLSTYEKNEVTFAAYFDHIKWLAISDNLTPPSKNGRIFLLEDAEKNPPPGALKLQTFPTKTLYWDTSTVEYR